jgi:putative membrane protein
LDKATRLAYDRTWLSYERTMQAWVRTAISLITFGFSVFKLAEIVDPNKRDPLLAGPHEFGIALVCIGFFALVIATIEYRRNIAQIRAEYGQSPRSLSILFAAVVAALGVFALLSMFF